MASCRMLSLRCPAATERSTKFFEIVTWAQLNIHSKPCVLINTDGYYDFLLRFLDHAVREEFVRAANLMLVQVARDSAEALQWIEQQRDNASLHSTVSAQNGGALIGARVAQRFGVQMGYVSFRFAHCGQQEVSSTA